MTIKFFILLLAIGLAVASPVQLSLSQVLAKPQEKKPDCIADFFTGMWIAIKGEAEGDFDNTVDCFYGFACSYQAIKDFVKFLMEMKEFDLEAIVEKFMEYIVLGVTSCVMPCMTPISYGIHWYPLIKSPNINGIIQSLLLGMCLGIQDIIMAFIDIIQALNPIDFQRIGANVGVMLWVIIIR